jgi:uncharacterized protein YgbK (DUF1537 family)
VSAAPEVAILADDLTGALDAAAPFAARGLSARVAVHRSGAPPEAEVVAANAASRHLSSAEAAAAAALEGARLAALRPKLLFKKIDSTLRGQVVAETASLLRVCGRARALVAPAFPAQGRTVEGGELRVHGLPLAAAAFARDARSPAPVTPLRELFADLPAEVPDARSEADMAALARMTMAEPDRWLAVGSAGFARSLAGLFPQRSRPASVTATRVAVVVGSRAAEARRQAGRLAAAGGARLLLPQSAGEPDDVAAELAARAAKADADAFVVVGGDTAGALLAAIGAEAIEVLDELLPGVPLCRLPDGRPLVSKAGAFGADDALVEIVARLRAPAAP